MAVPVARVHLAMSHAALPALLPTPPGRKMLPLLPTPCIAAAILQAKPLVKPNRHRSPTTRKSPPPPKPGRADSAERWDAHKKAAASPASSSPPPPSSGKWSPSISRASSAERWDVHEKRCPTQAELLDDDGGASSSTGSNDMDTEEEILWKPRGVFAGPGFVVAAPEPSMIPMPAAFLVPVA